MKNNKKNTVFILSFSNEGMICGSRISSTKQKIVQILKNEYLPDFIGELEDDEISGIETDIKNFLEGNENFFHLNKCEEFEISIDECEVE